MLFLRGGIRLLQLRGLFGVLQLRRLLRMLRLWWLRLRLRLGQAREDRFCFFFVIAVQGDRPLEFPAGAKRIIL